MTNVVIFGGTTEGRLLCEACADAVKSGAPDAGFGADAGSGALRVVYCVATRDGARAVEALPGVDVRVGRLGADEMAALLGEADPALVVDATHPYAAEASANIEAACRRAGVPRLLRVVRESGAHPVSAEQGDDSGCTYFDGMTDLLEWLRWEPGNIFVTTGSSAAPAFAALPEYQSRVWLRVLPNMESLRVCLELGYRPDRLICMQGPFSEDMNRAMFGAADARILVTKDSGAAGGFPEKLRAARGLGMRVAVLSRPTEYGMSAERSTESYRSAERSTEYGMSAERSTDSAARTAPFARTVFVTREEARERLLALAAPASAGGDVGRADARKRVTVVGTGLGAATTTPEAREAIARAEVLIGSPRVLEPYRDRGKPSYPYYLPGDVAAAVESEDAREFAVLVSGDVGFYSAAAGLCEALTAYELRLVPGVSSLSAFFARLKLPWQDATLVSAHGYGKNMDALDIRGRAMGVHGTNVVAAVRRGRLTFCLTGNNVNEIGAALCESGFGHIPARVGENLGTPDERLRETTAAGLASGSFPPLTVLLFVNEAFDDRTSRGLPDDAFTRAAGIPMTKSETRAAALSKLDLRPGDICWDVGAGTGSVTVEMALNAWRGRVYAVERRADALPLIRQNCAAFHVGNVVTVHGEAPAALETLPAPDAVFIGGGGTGGGDGEGGVGDIMAAVLRVNRGARIVVTAVTPETVSAAIAAFARAGLEPEIVQLFAARGKKAGGLHLMEAQNPITIICRGRCPHRPV